MRIPVNLVFLLWGAGCASLPAPAVAPPGPPVYVAPLIDETPAQALGFVLGEEIKERLWDRAPNRFSAVFEGEALALDATVLAIHDEASGKDAVDVVVRVEAILVDKGGALAYDLGTWERRGRYRPDEHQPAATAERRRRAISVARSTLAGALAEAALQASRRGADR